MGDKKCKIDGCERKSKSKGWCGKHYGRWYRHGDPLETRHFHEETLAERLASRSVWDGDCLVWTRYINASGYGEIGWNNKVWLVHRASYIAAHGSIPEGMFIDHICHNRKCLNIKHLRLATNKQNTENRAPRSTKEAGYRGVTKRRNSWIAQVTHNNKLYYLGSFPTAEQAAEVARLKRNALFTHNDEDRND